ncbi:hypothetical protein PAXINDRAFT_168318 [Paxillus involutus ATCC 200175]|nr:hypothetical protein PAXINDRAFT_168318 [Paxillus involutus ATCC 200175]
MKVSAEIELKQISEMKKVFGTVFRFEIIKRLAWTRASVHHPFAKCHPAPLEAGGRVCIRPQSTTDPRIPQGFGHAPFCCANALAVPELFTGAYERYSARTTCPHTHTHTLRV